MLAAGAASVRACEALEGVVGGLRVAVELQQARAGAEAALGLLGGTRIAPVEPKEALHVPRCPVAHDQLEGPCEHLLLALDALVEAEPVGRRQAPADLAD